MKLRAVIPALVPALAVLLCGTLYALGYRQQYADLLSAWGAAPFRFPFLDTHAVLSAAQCYRQGIDVYVVNPCDVFGRIHVYSPLWLWLAKLPVTTAWTPAVGSALVAAFLLSLTLLPPGRGWVDATLITLGAIPGSVAFALERANNDLVIFVLASLTIRLASRRQMARWVGYGLAVLAALLKFYPAVLLMLAVRERLSVFMAVGLAAAGVLAGIALLNAHDLMRVLSSIPTTSCFDAYAFGARDLPCGLGQTFGWPVRMVFVLLAAAVIAGAIAIVRRGGMLASVAKLTDLEASSLMAGCVLMLACFFTAQNVLYRCIYFLFVLPPLTALARRDANRKASTVARAGIVLVLSLMAWETFRHALDPMLNAFAIPVRYIAFANFNVWLIRELAWWLCMSILLGMLLALIAHSRVWREVRVLIRFCWLNIRIRAQDRHMRRVFLILLPTVLIAAAHASPVPPSSSAYCDTAIVNAERTVQTPPRLLEAIGEVESGRPDDAGRIRPWPWTLNAEGRGQFFATKADAIAAVRALWANGVRSIDVGCMQVNLMHHPNAFSNLDEAFDPSVNALFAARFLNSLFAASGSWVQATAAYHSETPSIGTDYQRRVMARWQMPGSPAVASAYGMFAPAGAVYADFQPKRAYADFGLTIAAPSRLARR